MFKLSWSPDSKFIVYRGDADRRGGGHDVCFYEAATGAVTRHELPLSLRYGVTDFAWSPDGSKIAVSGGHNVYLMNPDGSEINPLFKHTKYLNSPSWSPDGRFIVFAEWISADDDYKEDQTQIRIFDMRKRTFLEPNPYGAIMTKWPTTVSWSPRWNHLALYVPKQSFELEKIVIRHRGVDTKVSFGDSSSWSPNGRYIVCSLPEEDMRSEHYGCTAFHVQEVINSAGEPIPATLSIKVQITDPKLVKLGIGSQHLTSMGPTVRLTDWRNFSGSNPTWSPDGKRIAYRNRDILGIIDLPPELVRKATT